MVNGDSLFRTGCCDPFPPIKRKESPMFQLGKKIKAFAAKAPVAVLVRPVLQRDLNPERMDRLFHTSAEPQYERNSSFPLS